MSETSLEQELEISTTVGDIIEKAFMYIGKVYKVWNGSVFAERGPMEFVGEDEMSEQESDEKGQS